MTSQAPATTLPFAACIALLAGCAGSHLDPEGVGQGQYLQVLTEGRVVIETDTSSAGMLNCPNQAYQLMQQTPALKGRVKCSFLRTTDQLPYGFIAHRRLNESDGFKPSSPYLTRATTSQACHSMRNATAAMEKTVIIEDGCASPAATLSSQPVPAAAASTAGVPTTANNREQRAIAFRWSSDQRLMAAYVTLSQAGRSGRIAGKLPGNEGECSGMFETGPDGRGQWAIWCTNGLTAVGTFVALGAGKGSSGVGTDSRGQRVDFTMSGTQ